jgi:hypothetical protein
MRGAGALWDELSNRGEKCRGGFSRPYILNAHFPSSLLRAAAALSALRVIWGQLCFSMWVIAAWVVPLGVVTRRRCSAGESGDSSIIFAAPTAV